MLKVRYTEYMNDYMKHNKEKTFRSLSEVADWLFNMFPYSYDHYGMFFVNPDDERITHTNGKLHLDNSCISSSDGRWSYWVEEIIQYNPMNGYEKIIYSTGKYTNGISHWNEEVKQWLRECRARQKNPQFNFG